MYLIENIWFLISLLLLIGILVVDPKELNANINVFSYASSRQQPVAFFLVVLIILFIVVTIALSVSAL